MSKNKMPEMIKVESSNIEQVGYDKKNEILYITFKGGNTYSYDDVDEDTNERLLTADSIGSFFFKSIKNNFNCMKL